MMQVIRILPFDKQSGRVELQLYEGIQRYKTEDILASEKKLYEDCAYYFEVDEDLSNYASVSLFFNKELIQTRIEGCKIYVRTGPERQEIFNGFLGFLQVRLQLDSYNGDTISYYSEFASIMIKAGSPKSHNVESMLQYIYRNQKDLLYANVNVMSTGKNYGERFEDFASELKFLEELADVYENSVGYFKANSRFKLEQKDVVDSIYKMQYVSDKTVRHIVQHPDLLREGAVGIKVGKRNFMPEKTLMTQNHITFDIYENQVVVSFLKKIIYEARQLGNRISAFISSADVSKTAEGGYISSSTIIYANVIDVLKEYRRRTDEIYERFKRLLVIYSRIMPVSEVDCSSLPKPSPIFLSVPQYNRIYTSIHKWYHKSGYDFATERVMLQLMDIPSIYEAYVLVRLIKKIMQEGYERIAAQRVSYPNISDLFDRKECNNTFVFKKEDKEITLYYEPAIYNTNLAYNSISLYRNTSIPFSKGITASANMIGDETSFEGKKGDNRTQYYVPDFLFKYVENSRERYFVMDAKYTSLWNVKKYLIPELVYKYVFSLSPQSDKASIVGLGIFNGIYRGDSLQSVFDSPVSYKPSPVVDLIPLSEEMSIQEQDNNMNQLWNVMAMG